MDDRMNAVTTSLSDALSSLILIDGPSGCKQAGISRVAGAAAKGVSGPRLLDKGAESGHYEPCDAPPEVRQGTARDQMRCSTRNRSMSSRWPMTITVSPPWKTVSAPGLKSSSPPGCRTPTINSP